MNFPAYVPAAVRVHIATLLEGDSCEPHGWAASLANAVESLSRIDLAIETYIRRGEDDYLPGLRIQRAEAVAYRDRLAGHVDCLQRLANDARMCEAYARLTNEFSDDKQWRNFIYAAWSARMDFTKYRDRLKRATELKGEIADAAELLAKLIRQFADLPLELTLTCMTPFRGGHCGQCSKCGERQQAYVDAAVNDPTVYAAGEDL